MTTVSDATLGDAPVQGKITEEALDAARAMVGKRLRPEGPFLQDLTADSMRNFANGIGDVNPIYRDQQYGRGTQYGAMLAHPNLAIQYGFLGRTRWGLPGVHGFYAGTDWELFRHIVAGDRITCIERVVGVEEKESAFSGRLILQYVEGTFYNQRYELIARVLGWCTRHERRAARDKGKYQQTTRHEYTQDDLDRIDALALGEGAKIRGDKVRAWEDVREGDELDPIVRGPLSLGDLVEFKIGTGHSRGANGISLARALKHPNHFFRNKETGGGIEYTGVGHTVESVAKEIGVPGAYDYGPQRSAWMCSLVTNWMGDTAYLKRIRTEIRRFNVVGDTTWCKGKIAKKYVKDGFALVDIDIWGENQRGETNTLGTATVLLPSNDRRTKVFIDGSGVELDLEQVR